jgi:hypothetical protein
MRTSLVVLTCVIVRATIPRVINTSVKYFFCSVGRTPELLRCQGGREVSRLEASSGRRGLGCGVRRAGRASAGLLVVCAVPRSSGTAAGVDCLSHGTRDRMTNTQTRKSGGKERAGEQCSV